ncbi:MAG TPA: hypothetical protein VLC10_05515 [Patescibacteria group bacterium]|nr:hypothetical protein [Patescibacteria group bacterium]
MRSGLGAVAVTTWCALYSLPALAGGLAVVDGEGRSIAADAVLVKGKSLTLAAVAPPSDAGASAPTVAWKSEPEGVVAVADLGGGRASVTALRDWFDEHPGREPVARITACAGPSCATVAITCLPDVAGTWPTKLEVGGLFGGSEVRDLVFVQRGRYVTFDPEPANKPDPDRIATLRLDGNALRTVKKGNVLTRFDGALSDRETGRGNWSSSWGFSGVWTANKKN